MSSLANSYPDPRPLCSRCNRPHSIMERRLEGLICFRCARQEWSPEHQAIDAEVGYMASAGWGNLNHSRHAEYLAALAKLKEITERGEKLIPPSWERARL
jgi:hypothetical protein